ncbi:M3 family metallopeptidase [Nocardioides ferulae]|uniref:M3 family metallopeptidase n=1 Tax=Nocardioides ferulae TaxID=2340821 RepID=UPI000EB1C69C|nr:M3 family metallopeptidase [Nocardioides ferulae]
MTQLPLALPAADAETSEEWVRNRARDGLAAARELVERLRENPPAQPLEALRLWDEATLRISDVAAVAELFSNVHPAEAVRTSAEEAEQEVARLRTELGLDRRLYDVLAALDPADLDAAATRLLEKTLRDFRRAGVDRDDEARERIAALNERLTEVGQEFSKAIRDDVRTIRVAPERLAGLPQDWLDAHPAGDDGLVTVTTDYPDAIPVRTFCHDADVRRELTRAFLNRGWPATEPLLRELFDLRHERAQLVGYETWADFDAAVKMIGAGAAIPDFVDRIAEAAEGPARRDLAVLLERYRRDVPAAEGIDTADLAYYEELVRREQLDVDAQQVRTFFDFGKVRQGLLDVTGRLFGLRYEPVADAGAWHADVTTYDVFWADAADAGDPLGRIHLDLHPREGKYKHAAQFTLVDGVAGRQLPEGVLVCNFSRGLMEHDQVVTLFHEFGHLVHHVLAGRVEWARFSGVATEWDFVEAPSQMLEEWAWDPDVLRSFATDADGVAIPADLVERMRRADDFGKGYHARTQMFYAAMSYWFHTDRPADLTAAMRELQARYSMFAWIEGTHMFASFGHLGGYSSGYYTYAWSQVIAKDLFSAFDADDLFDADVAARYRDRVLAPGGTRDAADLVADFLGRPYTFDAYAEWLAR